MKKIILSLFALVAIGSVAVFGLEQNSQSNHSVQLPDLTSAAQKGVEAVVNIETTRTVQVQQGGGMDPFEFFFGPMQGGGRGERQPMEQQRKGGGSGVIISDDGYIVTNNHVVEDATNVKVTLHNGQSYTAKVVGTDPLTDIALVKIETPDSLPFLNFGNSGDLKLGQWVLAVGNPYGLTSTVTAGIVSAKGRSLGIIPSDLSIESFIQTDAAINPGNSGGALITVDGALIGINTLIKSPTGTYTGYSFAVPSSIASKVVDDIGQYGVVQRAILGIGMSEITDEWLEKFGKQEGVKERSGIYIGEVLENGAANAAGIKKGDILLELDNQPIASVAAVREAIASHRPGDKITIAVKRLGEVKHFQVTLRNRNGNEDVVKSTQTDLQQLLGGEFRNINDKAKRDLKIRSGVQVVNISSNGVLAKLRVRVGFIITAVNGKSINSVSDLTLLVEKIESVDGVYPDGRMATYQAM